MLPSILGLEGKKDPTVFDLLYTYFCRDFVKQDTYLASTIYINPNGQGMYQGKEGVFWHITTREQKRQVKQGKKVVTVKKRLFDIDRSSRIEWVRLIITQCQHDKITLFYHQETKGKKPIRLYLWAHDDDFVVIVQKLGRSEAYLVTSFYISEIYKRKTYKKWHQEYVAKTHIALQNCEWF